MPPDRIIFYPSISLVIGYKKPSRSIRRAQRFGKLARFDELAGKLAPKKRREWQ